MINQSLLGTQIGQKQAPKPAPKPKPKADPVAAKMAAYDRAKFGVETGGVRPFHISEEAWRERTILRERLSKPTGNPLARTVQATQKQVEKGNAEKAAKENQPAPSLTQRKIAYTQPMTANQGFEASNPQQSSLEKEMAVFDQKQFGTQTLGVRPEGISDSAWRARTVYRQKLGDRLGWDAGGRNAEVAKLGAEAERGKPENMNPVQRLEIAKEAAQGLPGMYDKDRSAAMISKVLGENPNIGTLGDAGLAINSLNQVTQPVSTGYTLASKDPRAMQELPGVLQGALTIGDIAAQFGMGAATGGTATGNTLSKVGQLASRYLAMDAPGYAQMIRDSGGVQGALQQFGTLIKDSLDPTSKLQPSQRIQGLALAAALTLGVGGKMLGGPAKVSPASVADTYEPHPSIASVAKEGPSIANAQPPLAAEAPAPTRTPAPSAELGGGTVPAGRNMAPSMEEPGVSAGATKAAVDAAINDYRAARQAHAELARSEGPSSDSARAANKRVSEAALALAKVAEPKVGDVIKNADQHFVVVAVDEKGVTLRNSDASGTPLESSVPMTIYWEGYGAGVGSGMYKPVPARPPVSPELPEQAPRVAPAAEQAGVGGNAPKVGDVYYDRNGLERKVVRIADNGAIQVKDGGWAGSKTIWLEGSEFKDTLSKEKPSKATSDAYNLKEELAAAASRASGDIRNPSEFGPDFDALLNLVDKGLIEQFNQGTAIKFRLLKTDFADGVAREFIVPEIPSKVAPTPKTPAEPPRAPSVDQTAPKTPPTPPKEPVAATAPKGGEPPKPPAQPKATKQPPKGDIKTTKQAEVKAAADAIGLDLTKEGKTLAQIAKEVEDGGHVSGANHAAEKALRGEALNTQEQVGLGMGVNNLKRQIKELDTAIRKAKKGGDEAATVDLLKRRAGLAETHANLLSGLYKARSESGRSLGSGKWFDLADYAVKEDVVSMAESRVKTEIPEHKRVELEEMSGRYAEQEAKVNELNKALNDSRAREAAMEKRMADHAITNRPPRTSRTARIPQDRAVAALKELGAFEPVVGAVPIFSPKQSRAFSTLANWAIGELEGAGVPVTADTITAKMRGLVEKNNIGHALFDEDYYRAIRQALLGDKSGSYSGVLDSASTWLDQKAAEFSSIKDAEKQARKAEVEFQKAKAEEMAAADKEFRNARREQIKQAIRDKDAALAKKLRDTAEADAKLAKEARARERQEAKVDDDWKSAFNDAQKKAEIEERNARRNDILDGFDTAKRNRNAEKQAQALIKGGTKDFGAIVKALQAKHGLSELDAAASARRAVYGLEMGLQRRFGKDLMDMSLEARRERAELEAIRKEIEYNIDKLTPQTIPAALRVTLRAAAFTNPKARILDVLFNALRFGTESVGKLVDAPIDTLWMRLAKTDGKRVTPSYQGMVRRSFESMPSTAKRIGRSIRNNFYLGDSALLEKHGYPRVGLNTKFEPLNKGVNFFARLPGYTDIPFKDRWYEVSLLEHVDNEVAWKTKQENLTPAQAAQYRKTLLDNKDGELYPLEVAAANTAEELVYANTTYFDNLIGKFEKAGKNVLGDAGGDWAMLAGDVLVTPYTRIFAKIVGSGTDYLWGAAKAGGVLAKAPKGPNGVPNHVRLRTIQLIRRNLFGAAIAYGAYEFNKAADSNRELDERRKRMVKLNPRGYVEFAEPTNASGLATPFLFATAMHLIDKADATPTQKDKWRKDAAATLLLETPLGSGLSDTIRAGTLKDDPIKYAARKLANATIPGAVRDSAKWFDSKPGSQFWEMDARDIDTKPDPKKTWVEQPWQETVKNEFKSRIPGLRNSFPSK